MKIAIHQPNYLPYIGYFQKMASCDAFVFLDATQFARDSYTQRVKIRTKDPPEFYWLKIPIEKQYHYTNINEIPLPKNHAWKHKHAIILRANYAHATYFDDEFIPMYYQTDINTLAAWNHTGIMYLYHKFGITTELLWESKLDMNRNLKKTDLLIDICKKVGADTFVSGEGAKKYLHEQKFSENDIKLEYFHFNVFEYPQRWPGFLPYMSAIDMLFNMGEDFCVKRIREGI